MEPIALLIAASLNAGTVLAIQAIRAAEPRPSPWAGFTGRILWALRPRGFDHQALLR